MELPAVATSSHKRMHAYAQLGMAEPTANCKVGLVDYIGHYQLCFKIPAYRKSVVSSTRGMHRLSKKPCLFALCPCAPAANSVENLPSHCLPLLRRPFLPDPCNAVPCLNGGICIGDIPTQTYICVCNAGWLSTNCQVPGMPNS